MSKNRHIYIFKVERELKLPENEMSDFLWYNFFQPTARQILNYWIDDFHNYYYHDKELFHNICSQLHYNERALEDIINSLILYITQQVDMISKGEYSYIHFIQQPALFFEIKKLIENTLEEYN